MTRFTTRQVSQAWLLGSWILAAGCGAEHAQSRFPEYTPEAALVFDDTFAQDVFGQPPEPTSGQLKFRERVRLADSVVVTKVVTVSRNSQSQGRPAYHLELRTAGPLLSGSPLGKPITVQVESHSPSYPWLEAQAQDLVGAQVVLFLKQFTDNENTVVHFRAERDSSSMRASVKAALLKATRQEGPAQARR